MGRLDHPDQGPDADPLQDRHDRLGLRRLRLLHVPALSIITRGLRFFIVAELLRMYGEPIRDFIEKRLTLVTTSFLAVVVGGFLIAKYAF